MINSSTISTPSISALLILTLLLIQLSSFSKQCDAFTSLLVHTRTSYYDYLKPYQQHRMEIKEKVGRGIVVASTSRRTTNLFGQKDNEEDDTSSDNNSNNNNNNIHNKANDETKQNKNKASSSPSPSSSKDIENNPDLLTWEELMRDPDYALIEYNKSRKRRNNLFLLQDIGKAFNALLWIFVISSAVLQSVGYGFVIIPSAEDGKDVSTSTTTGVRLGNSNIKIDTLENKAFLLEMNGKDEQAARIRKKYLKNYNDL